MSLADGSKVPFLAISSIIVVTGSPRPAHTNERPKLARRRAPLNDEVGHCASSASRMAAQISASIVRAADLTCRRASCCSSGASEPAVSATTLASSMIMPTLVHNCAVSLRVSSSMWARRLTPGLKSIPSFSPRLCFVARLAAHVEHGCWRERQG